MLPSQPSSARHSGLAASAAVATAVIVVATTLVWSLSVQPLDTDEAWSLVVTRRLLRGERLYSDVFSGVTPLSFQVQHAVGLVWQNSVLSIRMLAHLLQLFMIACCLSAAGRAGVAGPWRVTLLAGLLMMTVPATSSVYSLLATALACLALLCALSICCGKPHQRWATLAGGLACGLAVATKQNVGAVTTLAFLICLIRCARSGLTPNWRGAAAGLAAGAVLPMLPILVAGSMHAFVQFTVANKVSYVRNAGTSYWSHVNPTPLGEIQTLGFPDGMSQWLAEAPYLLPIVVLALAGIQWIMRRGLDDATATVLVFAVAALAGVYPRPDAVHFAIAVPALLVAVVVLLDRLLPRYGNLVTPAAGAALLLMWTVKVRDIAATTPNVPGAGVVPELNGLRLTSEIRTRFEAQRSALRHAAQGDSVMIVHADAPTLYLVSDVRNPTAFDYPLLPPFGARGQQLVLSAIERNVIRRACVQRSPWNEMEPVILTRGIRSSMHAAGSLGPCELFGSNR